MLTLAHVAIVAVAAPKAPPSAKIFAARSPPPDAKSASDARPKVTASHSAYISAGPKLPSAKTRRTFTLDPRHISTTVGIASAYVIVCAMAGSAGTAAVHEPSASNCGLTPPAPKHSAPRNPRNSPEVASALILPIFLSNAAKAIAFALITDPNRPIHRPAPFAIVTSCPKKSAVSSPHFASWLTNVQLIKIQNVTPAA